MKINWNNVGLVGLGMVISAVLFMRMDWIPVSSATGGDKEIVLGKKQADPGQYEAFPDPSPRIRAISRDLLPTVVTVQVTGSSRRQDYQFHNDDFFRRFFPDFPNREPDGDSRTPRFYGSGSGVIVTEDGYILTNNHVVEDATEDGIKVVLYDKREFKGRLIGRDPQTDLAVVKIDGTGLPVAPLGNSEKVEVGDFVIAIGTPLSQNLSSTVTMGIVSAIGRSIGIIGDRYGVENFIQTDAAINPGNSGGPLIGMGGSVIGINSAIASSTGGYQGYGFSIPINLARKVATDLIRDGKVLRGFVGISMREVDGTLAKALNLKPGMGVLVQDLVSGGPAEKAGIKQGDVILSVDGTEVSSGGMVQALIASKRPGDKVKMTIWRENKEKDFSVELVERASLETVASGKPEGPATESEAAVAKATVPKLGIEVRPLTRQEQKKYQTETGLFISRLTTESGFSQLAVGQVIVEVDRKEVRTVDEMTKILNGKSSGDAVLLKIKTPDGQPQYMGANVL